LNTALNACIAAYPDADLTECQAYQYEDGGSIIYTDICDDQFVGTDNDSDYLYSVCRNGCWKDACNDPLQSGEPGFGDCIAAALEDFL